LIFKGFKVFIKVIKVVEVCIEMSQFLPAKIVPRGVGVGRVGGFGW